MIPRYADPEMESIWNRQSQLHRWRAVELVWLKQLSTEGFDQARSWQTPDAKSVEVVERRTRHEFTAFLEVWAEGFRPDSEAARWVHYGLTSSDVIDTALALQLQDANDLLRHGLIILTGHVAMAAERVREVEQVGRTHGQWAQPRSAALPLDALSTMLSRGASRLHGAAVDLAESDFSGPTGAGVGIDRGKVYVAMRELGLRQAIASTQILPRDNLVHWAHVVSAVVTTCAAVAEHYWMLAQTEVAEVRVGDPAGSSAMPHKRNPATAENVMGLARLARGLAGTLDEGIVQRGDRDLAHSSVERVAVPDLCHLAATAIRKATSIVADWDYDREAIGRTMVRASVSGAGSHEEVMENVRQGMSRQAAVEKETRVP